MRNRLAFIPVFLLLACAPEYKSTQATITHMEIVNSTTGGEGHFVVDIAYEVEGKEYTDQFEMPMSKMVEDSVSTPAVGIQFDILYNPKNPQLNKIDFQVKPKYIN